VAVQVSERIGRQHVVETAQKLGITEPLDGTPAIALGVSETTLLEMTGAYATFANLGNGVWPRGIERITARDGTVLYERQGSGPGAVASGQAVGRMLDVMGSTVDWGTAKKAKLDRPVYGKTGTSQNFRDAWFIGLSRDVVTGIWVGNDNNAPMDKVTGGSLPVAIWHDFMAQALQGTPPEDVRRPQAIAAIAVATPVDLGSQKSDGSWLSNLFGGDTGGGGNVNSTKKSERDAAREKAGLPKLQGNNK
jgi:penicillin-binding protein 1A